MIDTACFVLCALCVCWQPTDVKKRVESLIDREYLERDESDLNVYKYLA